jgi:hypothetical protein
LAGSIQAGTAKGDIPKRQESRHARPVRPARIAWKAEFDANVRGPENARLATLFLISIRNGLL